MRRSNRPTIGSRQGIDGWRNCFSRHCAGPGTSRRSPPAFAALRGGATRRARRGSPRPDESSPRAFCAIAERCPRPHPIFDAVRNADLPLIQAIGLTYCIVVLLINTAVDSLYVVLNPKLRVR